MLPPTAVVIPSAEGENRVCRHNMINFRYFDIAIDFMTLVIFGPNGFHRDPTRRPTYHAKVSWEHEQWQMLKLEVKAAMGMVLQGGSSYHVYWDLYNGDSHGFTKHFKIFYWDISWKREKMRSKLILPF